MPDVPFEVVVLSRDNEEIQPVEVNQDPPPTDEKSRSACILLDSSPSKKEAPGVVPNLLEHGSRGGAGGGAGCCHRFLLGKGV